jgi:hypothetical protein
MSGTSTQTDVYGLAATFYTLLTGEIPIDSLYRITRLSGKRPDPLELANELVPTIPMPIAEALQKAMAVNSNDRFASVKEFWEILRSYPIEEPTTDLAVEQAQLSNEAAQHDVSGALSSFPDLAPDTPPVLHSAAMLTPAAVHSSPGKSKRSQALLYSLLTLLVLVSIVSGALLSTSRLGAKSASNVKPQHGLATPSHQPARVQITPTAAEPTATASTVTPPALKELTPNPVIVPVAAFPLLSTGYSGSIHNTPASVDSSMTIAQIKQSNGNISGFLSLGPGLLGSGNFNGTVTEDKKLQFLVPSYSGLLPLFFQGQILANGSISGTYCSYQNGQCNFGGGGYGTWQLSPLSFASEHSKRPDSSYAIG